MYRNTKRVVLLIAVVIMMYFLYCSNLFSFVREHSGYIHFSIDDSNDIFADLTAHSDYYDSIFQNQKLRYVKDLHDKYGIVVSFYVFYSWNVEKGMFSLSECTNRFKDEFTENAGWLRFGFHAKDELAYETLTVEEELKYYNKTIDELLRITGSSECIDNYVRLDRFVATEDMLKEMADTENGIVGLLCSDDSERQSYALSKQEQEILWANDWYVDRNGLNYTPTDLRLENIGGIFDFFVNLNALLGQKQLIVFTHEWKLDDRKVRMYMHWISLIGKFNACRFAFPEDMS